MATSPKKNTREKKPAASIQQETDPAVSANRLRQIKLAFGLLFLMSGIFICFAIFSYLFTWQADQDMLLSATSAGEFIKDKSAPVANWGGRLGALLSHYLVYRGVGLAGAAAGLWLAVVGLHIVYGRRMAPLMRYLRWLCLIVLVLAPILAYLFPKAAFSFGGALGNEAISYSNGLIGNAGTGMVLAGVAFFVLFVIFALDISPLIRRARASARKMREGIQQLKNKNGSEEGDDFLPEHEGIPLSPNAADQSLADAEGSVDVTEINNGLNGEAASLTAIDEFTGEQKKYNLSVNEKAQLTAQQQLSTKEGVLPTPVVVAPVVSTDDLIINNLFAQTDPQAEEQPAEETQTAECNYSKKDEMTSLEIPAATALPANALPKDLSFEVVHQADEKPAPAIANGAHISIESGEPYAPELDLPNYKFPTLDLLEQRAAETIAFDKDELEKNKNQIIQTLRSFGIEIQRISATVGPTVTLYEIVPAEGVRISKIRNLEDDIALNLAALGIRIIAPIPGRGTIGIEVPNANKQIVSMRALLSSEKFVNSKMALPIALGKQINNENYIVDLATMPHLLMAGATGQGKSVGINAILVSLLYKKHPSQLKFVMVDPKKVELSVYKLIEKHFLAKLPNEEEAIITDTKKVINTLNALCIEMDNRYELLKEAGARNIKEYNEKFIARRLNPEKGHKYLPFIVLVVDEFADLIMTAGKEVEMPIARIAQLARAVGIHLIVATQRPSVNVITGTIKANFPARIAFKVSAKVDSRTILDASGAEQLVGRGDMLVSHGSELLRLQCAFVDTPEVERIVEFIGSQRGYATAFELPEYEGDEGESSSKNIDLTSRDKMFEDSARLVVGSQSGSTSNIQRKFNLGYNRAGRIMDQLESAGIVGPTNGSKPREVLYKTEYELEQFLDTLL